MFLASGMDIEDAVQHLVIVLAARLQGEHPFDPSKSSLKNYLFLLTRTWLQNQVEKRAHRLRAIEAIAPLERLKIQRIHEERLAPEAERDVMWLLGYRPPRVEVRSTEEAWRLLTE